MGLGAAAFFSCAVLAAAPDGGYPEDPFAQEDLPPVAREYGTSAGQVRLSGQLGAVGLLPVGFLGATVEAMPSAWLGVRISGTAAFTHRTSRAWATSAIPTNPRRWGSAPT